MGFFDWFRRKPRLHAVVGPERQQLLVDDEILRGVTESTPTPTQALLDMMTGGATRARVRDVDRRKPRVYADLRDPAER